MKIGFQTLQERLRAGIWARLERGELTGKALAHKAGFQQAHLSNFLNGKRGLSRQAMDRLLDALHLDVLQLADVDQALRHPSDGEHPADDMETVALVSLPTAARVPRFSADHIQDVAHFRRSFLRRLKPKTLGNRRDWTRFAAVTVGEEDAASMAPLLRPDAQLLLDRHYNAPPVHHAASEEVYGVIEDGCPCITRITVTPGHLILRPLCETQSSPVRLIVLPRGRGPGHFIIGRVRYVAMEI